MKQFIYIWVLLLSFECFSDQYSYAEKVVEEKFSFESVDVINGMDNTGEYGPKWYVKYVLGDVELIYPGITFDKVVIFPSGSYFLGVSNRQSTHVVYFVMRIDGVLVSMVSHSQKFEYCSRSISLIRKWIDLDDIDLQEEFVTSAGGHKSLQRVTVKHCNGSRIEVWHR